MIARVQALNYRCLRAVDCPLGPFHVLVGPNASGKSTFLDVIAFLGELVSDGLEQALQSRAQSFHDLVWRRAGDRFELALEAVIPEELRQHIEGGPFHTIRYEVAVGLEPGSAEIALLEERVSFNEPLPSEAKQRELFPAPLPPPTSLMPPRLPRRSRSVIKKVPGGNDNFYAETGKSYNPSFKLGPRKSALGNLPADEVSFPVANWLRVLLVEGVQPVFLKSHLLRAASPPGRGRRFKPDGSNLPWVVEHLRTADASRFRAWVGHLQAALPDLKDIEVKQREDDKHAYLLLHHQSGLQTPSWMASDGTLRMLALTLPAYLPEMSGIYLIEEPENGIHPRAVEPVLQSLSSVYAAQVLLASHSPVVLSLVQPQQVLCFAKGSAGETDLIPGHQHPALREWRGNPQFATLFAAGVLN